MPVLISVVICSHNGERLLEAVIASVRHTLADAGGGELILVNSASTDGTLRIMDRAASTESATVLSVLESGAARARNAGWEAAAGDVVLFTDDDVIVPVKWAAMLTAPLRDGHAAVGGSVHLLDSVARGLSPRRCEFLADTRYMNLGGDPPRTIVGASMGLRRRLYDLGFQFDTRLGPGALGFMEESLLHMQITAAGGTAAFVDSVPVVHHVDRHRLEPEGWRRRAARQGACEAWIGHHWLHEVPGLADWKHFAGAEVRTRRSASLTSDDDSLDVVRAAAAGRWWLKHRFARRHYARREVPALIR
jgi:glycosyltransferase involved in cell wall biosynthesis